MIGEVSACVGAGCLRRKLHAAPGGSGAVDFNLLMSKKDGFVEPVNFGENVLHVQ